MFSLYKESLALLTDLYEITMAYAYWKSEMAEDEGVFHLFFRKGPFQGGLTVSAGLESVIQYLNNWRFDVSDLDYLANLKTEEGENFFEPPFLDYLANMRFTCDLDAVREGDLVFPYEPLIRVRGPLIQAQLLETPLLTLTNFSSLIATKAARVCHAAAGDPVIEFGLRRAQGIDGAMTATRSSYIGGCTSTSNTLAGKLLGIPVKGTHAHSWVMAFGSELEAFKAYARALPHQSVFLVDTYDSLTGVRHAIEIGKWLKNQGKPFLGIRLDSGDIHYLSIQSRKLLDAAGFPEAKIYASNGLDETLIADLKRQGAQVAVWGVGTHLVTGSPQAALDGVYKLSAYRPKSSKKWEYKLKLSERMTKISDPGVLQIARFLKPGLGYVADAVYDIHTDLSLGSKFVDPFDTTRSRRYTEDLVKRDVLTPIFRQGECVYSSPSLKEIQTYCKQELALFDQSVKRFFNPHSYPVGMEENLFQTKLQLIDKVKQNL